MITINVHLPGRFHDFETAFISSLGDYKDDYHRGHQKSNIYNSIKVWTGILNMIFPTQTLTTFFFIFSTGKGLFLSLRSIERQKVRKQ